MTPSPTTRRGFTLMEVMVSVAILVVMVLMLARLFSEGSRSIAIGRDQAQLDATARLLLDEIETDVRQALVRTNVDFRVQDDRGGESLRFLSAAAQRYAAGLPRDIASMQIRSEAGSNSVLAASVEIPAISVGTNLPAQLVELMPPDTDGHAVLVSLEFRINGQPNANDMPRFVDVVVGLADALGGTNGLADRARFYARRVPLRNTGVDAKEF